MSQNNPDGQPDNQSPEPSASNTVAENQGDIFADKKFQTLATITGWHSSLANTDPIKIRAKNRRELEH